MIAESENESPAGPQPAPEEEAQAQTVEALDEEDPMAEFEAALKEADWGHQPC